MEPYWAPLMFLIVISDIDKDVSASKLVGDVTDCDNLQFDSNAVYDWASSNNMFFLTTMCLPISQICIFNLR